MEVLCAKQRYSLKRITTGESTPVSFVSTVGVGVGANFLTTDMEDEPPFSLKKGLHCVATVTKQFYRFYIDLSSLSFPPTQPFTLNFLVPDSFIHSCAGTQKSCHNTCSQRAISAADRQRWIRTFRWPTGSRPIRHTHCLTWICHKKHQLTFFQHLFCHEDPSDTGHHVIFN